MRTAKSATERGLSPRDQERLSRAMGAAREARVYKRLQAVLLVARDMPVEEVARIVAAKPWAVYNWVRKYLRTRDPDSLRDAPRSGHPKVAEAITGEVILQEMSQDPMEVGYNATGWTVGLLAAHLRRKYGEDLSDQTLRRRMHETGLRWKRPRYVYSTKDPNRGQKKGVLYAG